MVFTPLLRQAIPSTPVSPSLAHRSQAPQPRYILRTLYFGRFPNPYVSTTQTNPPPRLPGPASILPFFVSQLASRLTVPIRVPCSPIRAASVLGYPYPDPYPTKRTDVDRESWTVDHPAVLHASLAGAYASGRGPGTRGVRIVRISARELWTCGGKLEVRDASAGDRMAGGNACVPRGRGRGARGLQRMVQRRGGGGRR